MITVKFANGKEYKAESIDDAIAQCLSFGDDPFGPVVIPTVEVLVKSKKEVAPKE